MILHASVAALIVLACLGRVEVLNAAAPRPLNVVVILIDDLGWRDVGYNGSRFYETPNIDALAQQGAVFNWAYAAAPLCSPTRAALLTGKSPARLQLTAAIGAPEQKPRAVELDDGRRLMQAPTRDALAFTETTLAQRLEAADYATGLIGKWHLGSGQRSPSNSGFLLNIGGNYSSHPLRYFSPYFNETIQDGPKGEYLTDRLTDEAIGFLRRNKDKPFFLYLSHYAVHFPWEAKPDLVARFRDRVRADEPQNNPVYAGMVASVDESVGRVWAALRELQLLETTAIILTSDNGGVTRFNGSQYPHTAYPPPLGTAITSNLPLRGGKGNLYEGGLRVPLVVHWPGVTRAGTEYELPVVTMDLYPTILRMANVSPRPGESPDGKSLEPLFFGASTLSRETLCFHLPNGNRPASAMRQGRYKLIHWYEGLDELFDLTSDVGERTNLAAQEPERVVQMREECLRQLRDQGAAFPTIR
ncbi:MAG: sulfatase [Pirellulales bacterium]|nr:sulfatase [Pirellulales bacterium]